MNLHSSDPGAISALAPSDHPRLHFGGPDLPPRHLRHLLRARIDAVPPGGEIIWCTYYFRDRDLARALIEASDRGVRVALQVEGLPRRASANRAVLDLLQAHGLKGGLHIHKPESRLFAWLHPHLHAKIYYFSHPAPYALVGSFNPSGDDPEDMDVIAEIGDQDRGHNLLVEFPDPALVASLREHVLGLGRVAPRLRWSQNRAVEADAATAWFYPRVKTGLIDNELARLGRGCRISGAISHLKKGTLLTALARASRKGAEVRLLVHDTARRVPPATVEALAEAGISVRRYVHPEGLPIHSKFLLVEEPEARTAWFGSFNYNPRSRWLNHELLLASRHPAITDVLATRFEQIASELPDAPHAPAPMGNSRPARSGLRRRLASLISRGSLMLASLMADWAGWPLQFVALA